MKNKLWVVIIVFLLLIPGYVFAESDYIQIGPDGIETRGTYEDIKVNSLKANGFVTNSGAMDLTRSHSSPNFFSSNVETSWIWFSLRDSNYNEVTGIKVSRIELIQNNKVIARTHDVDSYSTIGEYGGNNYDFINSFENNNGDNFVDVVFYLGSKEVARIKDFKFGVYSEPIVSRLFPYSLGIYNAKFTIRATMLNVGKDSNVDVYLTDNEGNRITKVDKKHRDYYSSKDNTRSIEFNISFLDEKYLVANNNYNCVITVDGKEVINKDYNSTISMSDNLHINSTSLPNMPNLRYSVNGINVVKYGPYRMTIEQNNKITKEISNINALFNEENYREEIIEELLPEYFADYGAMYKIRLFDSEGKQVYEHQFLQPIDDTSQEVIDKVDAFEGFKVFNFKKDVEPNKTWKVRFNQAIDRDSINNGNSYVYNKRTGITIKVDYNFESGEEILTMTPREQKFQSGETYVLIIAEKIKSANGKNLSQPAAIEFTVR